MLIISGTLIYSLTISYDNVFPYLRHLNTTYIIQNVPLSLYGKKLKNHKMSFIPNFCIIIRVTSWA